MIWTAWSFRKCDENGINGIQIRWLVRDIHNICSSVALATSYRAVRSGNSEPLYYDKLWAVRLIHLTICKANFSRSVTHELKRNASKHNIKITTSTKSTGSQHCSQIIRQQTVFVEKKIFVRKKTSESQGTSTITSGRQILFKFQHNLLYMYMNWEGNFQNFTVISLQCKSDKLKSRGAGNRGFFMGSSARSWYLCTAPD